MLYGLALFLAIDEFDEKAYVYDHDSRSVYTFAQLGIIEWPVTWLLACHHRKHVFLTSGIPSMQLARRSIGQFCHKLRWRFVFETGLLQKGTPLPESLRTTTTVPCRVSQLPRDFDAWAVALKDSLLKQCSRVLDEFKHGQHRFWSCRPRLLNVATKAMSRCGWIPLPCDKDGGYTLVAASQLSAIYSSSMKAIHYQQINPMNEPIHSIIGGHYSLCDQISKASKYHRIGWRVKSSMLPIQSLRSLSSPIALHCKTH